MGKKIDYYFIFYKMIIYFSVEMVGMFDLDVELNIWVLGFSVLILKEFCKDKGIYDV